MTINCNVTGSERKRLAQVLGALLLQEPVYTKAPTFAYTLGDYTIDKNGTIICPESTSVEDVAKIVTQLTNEGFSPEIVETDSDLEDISADSESLPLDGTSVPAEEIPAEIPAETPDVAPEDEAEAAPEAAASEATVGEEMPNVAASEEEAPAEADPPVKEAAEIADEAGERTENPPDENQDKNGATEADEHPEEYDTKLTISIPRDKLSDDALVRLRTIVSNKEELLKRALLTDTLSIEVSDTEISFPWFTLTGTEGEPMAYTQFITALCQMATEQTRVLDKPYNGDNDRFVMRIFMVRLGMKGAEFALARKLLMKHLTGNSGWRYGDPATKPEHRGTLNRSTVQHIKKAYPNGIRLTLIPTDDASGADIQIGENGAVIGVDDNGSMFIKLDNGSAFGIAFNTESVKETEAPVSEEEADTSAEDGPADIDKAVAKDASDSNDNSTNPNEAALPDEDESDAEEGVPVSDEYFRPDEDEPDAEDEGEDVDPDEDDTAEEDSE